MEPLNPPLNEKSLQSDTLAPRELLTDILSAHKTYSFEDLHISLKTLLSTHQQDLLFTTFTATKLFEYITLKLQQNLTVSTPNPLVLDTLLHDISPLLRLFFTLETFIINSNSENDPSVQLNISKNLFRHFLSYIGSKETLETQDHLLVDLMRIIINPSHGFASSLSEAQLVSVIEEEISEFKPSIYPALSRIFRFLDKRAIVRLCNDPMLLIKGILDSIEDIESPIFHEVVRFLYAVHLNPQVQKVLIHLEIHMILYRLLQIPYQDFHRNSIPEPFHQTREACLQIIVDCLSVQDKSVIEEFVTNLLRSDPKYLADDKGQLFNKEIIKPLLKVAPLSNLQPISLNYQHPLMNHELFKNIAAIKNEPINSQPNIFTQEQYKKLLKYISFSCTNSEKVEPELNSGNLKYDDNSTQSEALELKWKKIDNDFIETLQTECCVMMLPCQINQTSLQFGLYLTQSPHSLQNEFLSLKSLKNFMFYVVNGQFYFLTNQLQVDISKKSEDICIDVFSCSLGEFYPISINSNDRQNPNLGRRLLAFTQRGDNWVYPKSIYNLVSGPQKNLWASLTIEELYGLDKAQIWSGFPFYNTQKLQPSFSSYISPELIQNTVQKGSDSIYLVPKNLSLDKFFSALYQDSPDTIRFLQVEHNNKILKPNQTIDQVLYSTSSDLTIPSFIISSSYMELQVLKHLSASPSQVLQRILNQYPDSLQKPIISFLNESIDDTLRLFEELSKTQKVQNPNLIRKFVAVNQEFGSCMTILQTILGETFINLLIDFLLENSTNNKYTRVFTLSIFSLLKFQDIFLVTTTQLCQLFNVMLMNLISFSTISVHSKPSYIKEVLDLLNQAFSQVLFISDPRLFQLFIDAILWRSNTSLNQITSILQYDNSLLIKNPKQSDEEFIEQELEAWSEILLTDPSTLNMKRLQTYILLERWVLILDKLPNQIRSHKLASHIIKTLKTGLYESLSEHNINAPSKNLFTAFDQICQEKFIDTPQLFMDEISNSFIMVAWTQTISKQYLSLFFESFDYNLFLDVIALPLMGFKLLQASLLKDSLTSEERSKTLQSNRILIGNFLQFLQQLGSKSYFAQKFKFYNVDEFYEQWIATMLSLNLPKILLNLLFAFKDSSLECDFFLQLLELLHVWSENKIIVNIFKIEFHGTALQNCQDKNIAPSNLEGVLLYLMRNLAINSKQNPENSKKTEILQLTSKTLVLIQKIRTNINK